MVKGRGTFLSAVLGGAEAGVEGLDVYFSSFLAALLSGAEGSIVLAAMRLPLKSCFSGSFLGACGSTEGAFWLF